LKRKKQTFYISLTQPITSTKISQQLHQIISSIGGLGSGDSGSPDGEEEEIDIPVPTFETMDSDSEDDKEKMNDITSTSNTKKNIPDLDDIVIGFPRDVNDPYGSGFKDVKNDEKLEVMDFGILGFRLRDEEFEVIEPIDEE